ncbi:MAG: hypothetical protein ACRDRK_21740 [Pseudonocardia sp.]
MPLTIWQAGHATSLQIDLKARQTDITTHRQGDAGMVDTGAGAEPSWGARLREWRESTMRWSQQELVDRIVQLGYRTNAERGTDLNVGLLQKWENGKVRRPNFSYRRLLAELGAPTPDQTPKKTSFGEVSGNDSDILATPSDPIGWTEDGSDAVVPVRIGLGEVVFVTIPRRALLKTVELSVTSTTLSGSVISSHITHVDLHSLGVMPTVVEPSTLDSVDRRSFLTSTAAVAVAAMLPQNIATPGRVGGAEVVQCWSSLRRLFQLDDHHGGGMVYEINAAMATRLQEALHQGTYGQTIAQDFQAVTAATMEHAGWLAYDAGLTNAARRWWLETCHLAEIANLPGARVTALTSMALHATTSGAPRDALGLIAAARECMGDAASPTLRSLLAAREAVAFSQIRDSSAARRAVTEARRWLLDYEKQQDEALWLQFWNPADLAWHETSVALALGDVKAAEKSARAAVTNSDQTLFPRNHALYTVRLGGILTHRGQLEEAIAVTTTAVKDSDLFSGSRRIMTDLHSTLELLSQQKFAPARTFAEAARKIAPVPA